MWLFDVDASDDEKVQQRRVSCNKCYNKHTRLEGDKCKYLRNRITRRGYYIKPFKLL